MRVAGLLGAMALLLAACSASGAPSTPAAAREARSMTLRTVFLIVMENHDWSSIRGNPSAPYINRTLLPMASYATAYYNPPNNHPSLPNYLWLEAGTNFGIADDADPSANHQSATTHLVTLLQRAGIPWTSYQESIGGKSCPLTGSYPYAPKHNPMVYFDDVTNHNNPRSRYCIAHERPYTELARNLARNAVTGYNFITPNLCDDMHDTCSPIGDAVRQGDTWLSHAVPRILASRAYRRGVLFITWDEGEGDDGPIGMIVLSPYAKGHGYHTSIHYTHSSTLRTIEEIFGVRPLLGDARHATDLRSLFRTFP